MWHLNVWVKEGKERTKSIVDRNRRNRASKIYAGIINNTEQEKLLKIIIGGISAIIFSNNKPFNKSIFLEKMFDNFFAKRHLLLVFIYTISLIYNYIRIHIFRE